MNVLLDTHVWLRVPDGRKLSTRARSALDAAPERYLSATSLVELRNLARDHVDLGPNPASWLRDAVDRSGVIVLPVDVRVALAVHELGDYPGRDPADQAIVATAIAYDLLLVTADREMHGWPAVRTTW